MTSIHQLAPPTEGISCHAWNADKSMIALCPNNNEIHIYETKTWTRLHVLAEHDLLVSAIDWSAETNKIVSCSHDRNAFVWTFEPENTVDPATWKPALVILRIDRAAVDVKWSSDGLRFAVASGAKCVPVCTYDQVNDWWVCKMVKKFKSTVLCCAFHPTNGQLLATGSSDFRMRVFSTFATDVDGTNVDAGPFAGRGGPQEFGETYLELSALGWVHAVAWSPSGNYLAFAGQDSSVHVVSLHGTGEPLVTSIRLRDLPLSSLLFLSEKAFVGAGHDFAPQIFTQQQESWSLYGSIDKTAENNNNNAASPSAGGVSAARALFKNKTVRGQDSKGDSDTLKTLHANTITCIRDVSPSISSGKLSKISTSGLDGKLIVWNLPSLDLDMAALGL